MALQQFLATAVPKRNDWQATMTDAEKLVMAQHFAYANQLVSEGHILFDGACLDGAMGIIVYTADS